MSRRRSRVEMTRQSLTRSTLLFLRQLSGHARQIDCITYNSRRHHVLTADDTTMRLWSLRKEMKKVPLPRLKDCALAARFLELMYYSKQDLYLVLCKGDPRSDESRSYAGYVLGYRAGLLPALEFQAHSESEIVAGAFHEGRQELVTCDASGCLKVWAFASVEAQLAGGDAGLQNEQEQEEEQGAGGGTLQVFHKSVLDLKLAHPAQQLHLDDSSGNSGPYRFAFVGCAGGRLSVVDLASNSVLCSFECNARTSAGDANGGTDSDPSGENGNRGISSITFSSETQHILVGFTDGSIDLFVLHRSSADASHSLILLSSFACHEDSVTDVVFVPHVNGVVSCGKDNVVRHWKPPTCGEVGRYQHLHQPAPVSHVPHNRRLQHVYVRKILPVKIEVDAMCSKQLLLVVTGELVTILEVLSPCLSFAEPQGGTILGLQAVTGNMPAINFDPKLDRAAVERGHHHVVSLSQGNAISIFDAADGRQAFSFALPQRKEYDSHEEFHVGQYHQQQLLQQQRQLCAVVNSSVGPTKNGRLGRLEDIAGSSRPNSRGSVTSNASGRPNSRGSLGLGAPLPANNAAVCKYLWCPVQTLHAVGWSDGKVDLIDSNAEIKHTLVHPESLAAVKAMCIVQTSGPDAKRVRKLQLEITPPSGYQALDPNSEMARSIGSMTDNSDFRRLNKHIGGTVKNDDPFVGALSARQNVRLQSPSIFRRAASAKSNPGETVLNQLIVGSIDGLLRVWQVETEKLWHTVRAHSGAVVDIVLVEPVPTDERFGSTSSHPRIRCILSAGTDGFVKLWSIGDLSLLGFAHVAASARCEGDARLRTPSAGARSSVSSVAALPRCGLFVVGFENGVVQSWSLPMPLKQQVEEYKVYGTEEERSQQPAFHGSASPHASHRVHAKRVSQLSTSLTQPNVFLSASMDHTVMLWCVREDNKLDPVRRMTFPAPVQTATFTPVCDEILVSWGNSLSVVSYWEHIDGPSKQQGLRMPIGEQAHQQSETSEHAAAVPDVVNESTVKVEGDGESMHVDEQPGATAGAEQDKGLKQSESNMELSNDHAPTQSDLISISVSRPQSPSQQQQKEVVGDKTLGDNYGISFDAAFASTSSSLSVSASAPSIGGTQVGKPEKSARAASADTAALTAALMPVQIEVLRSAFERHPDQQNGKVPTRSVAGIVSSLGWTDLKMHILHSVAERAKIDLLRPEVDFATVLALTDAFLISSEAEYLLGRRTRDDYEQIAETFRASTAKAQQLHKKLDKKYKEMCKTRGVVQYNSMGERAQIIYRDLGVPENPAIHTKYTKPDVSARVFDDPVTSSGSGLPDNFVPQIHRLPKNFLEAMRSFYGEAVAAKIGELDLQPRWMSRVAAHKLLKDFVRAKQAAGPTTELEQCIFHWHKHKYGNGVHLWHVVAERLITFLEALHLHARGGDALCQTYAWFLGVSPDGYALDYQALQVYLQTQSQLIQAAETRQAGPSSTRKRRSLTEVAQVQVTLQEGLEIYRSALQDPVHWRVLSAVEKGLIQHAMDFNQCGNMPLERLLELYIDPDYVAYMFLQEYVAWGPKTKLQGAHGISIMDPSRQSAFLFESNANAATSDSSLGRGLRVDTTTLELENNLEATSPLSTCSATTATSPTGSVTSPTSGKRRKKKRKKPTGPKYKGLTTGFVPGEDASFSLSSTFVGNSSGEAMYLFSRPVDSASNSLNELQQIGLEPNALSDLVARQQSKKQRQEEEFDIPHSGKDSALTASAATLAGKNASLEPPRPQSRGRLKRDQVVPSYTTITRPRPDSSEYKQQGTASRGLAGVVIALGGEMPASAAPSIAHYSDPSLRFDQAGSSIVIEREYPTGRSSICTRHTVQSRHVEVQSRGMNGEDLSETDTDTCSEAESSEDGRLLPSPLANRQSFRGKRASVSMAGLQQKMMQEALSKRNSLAEASISVIEESSESGPEGEQSPGKRKGRRASSKRRTSGDGSKDVFGERNIRGERRRRPSSAGPRGSFSLSSEFFEETRRSLAATLPPEQKEEADRKRRISMDEDALERFAQAEALLEKEGAEYELRVRNEAATTIQALTRGFIMRSVMGRCAPMIDPEFEALNVECPENSSAVLALQGADGGAPVEPLLTRKSSTAMLLGSFKRASSLGTLKRASVLAKSGSLDLSKLLFVNMPADTEYSDSDESFLDDSESQYAFEHGSIDDENALLESLEPSITFEKAPPKQRGSVHEGAQAEISQHDSENQGQGRVDQQRSNRSVFAPGKQSVQGAQFQDPAAIGSDSPFELDSNAEGGVEQSCSVEAEITLTIEGLGDDLVSSNVQTPNMRKNSSSPSQRASTTTSPKGASSAVLRRKSSRQSSPKSQDGQATTQGEELIEGDPFDNEDWADNLDDMDGADALVELEELIDQDLMNDDDLILLDDDLDSAEAAAEEIMAGNKASGDSPVIGGEADEIVEDDLIGQREENQTDNESSQYIKPKQNEEENDKITHKFEEDEEEEKGRKKKDKPSLIPTDPEVIKKSNMEMLALLHKYSYQPADHNRKMQVEQERGAPELVSQSNAFGDPIRFAPLTLMKQSSSLPHWQEEEDADPEDVGVIEEDVATKNFVDVGNLDFLYNVEKEKECSVTSAPPIEGVDVSSWTNFFRKIEDMLRPPAEEPIVTDLDRQEARLKEIKRMLRLEGLDTEAPDNSNESRFAELKEPQRVISMWKKIRGLVSATSQFRKAREERASLANSGNLGVREINLGQPIKGKIASNEFAYYSFHLTETQVKSFVTISIDSADSDPDLFLSTETVPTVKDYTWRTSAIGNRRIVLFPGSDKFDKGSYFIGVFSLIPASFRIVVDLQTSDYASDALDNVATLTNKFNVVASMKTGGKSRTTMQEFYEKEQREKERAERKRLEKEKRAQERRERLAESKRREEEEAAAAAETGGEPAAQDGCGPLLEHLEPGNGAMDDTFTDHYHDQDEKFERMVVRVGRRELRAHQFDFMETASTASTEESASSVSGSIRGKPGADRVARDFAGEENIGTKSALHKAASSAVAIEEEEKEEKPMEDQVQQDEQGLARESHEAAPEKSVDSDVDEEDEATSIPIDTQVSAVDSCTSDDAESIREASEAAAAAAEAQSEAGDSDYSDSNENASKELAYPVPVVGDNVSVSTFDTESMFGDLIESARKAKRSRPHFLAMPKPVQYAVRENGSGPEGAAASGNKVALAGLMGGIDASMYRCKQGFEVYRANKAEVPLRRLAMGLSAAGLVFPQASLADWVVQVGVKLERVNDQGKTRARSLKFQRFFDIYEFVEAKLVEEKCHLVSEQKQQDQASRQFPYRETPSGNKFHFGQAPKITLAVGARANVQGAHEVLAKHAAAPIPNLAKLYAKDKKELEAATKKANGRAQKHIRAERRELLLRRKLGDAAYEALKASGGGF